MTDNPPVRTTPDRPKPDFEGWELRASIRFQPERHLRGPEAEALVDEVLSRLVVAEQRTRALKAKDKLLRAKTVNVLLAHLAVAALNRANSRRFVAIPLRPAEYAHTGLSYTTMELAYRLLQVLGLAVGKIGRAKPIMGEQHGVRTRLRATRTLRDLMKGVGLRASHIISPPTKLTYLKGAYWNAGHEPAAVAGSKATLTRINGLLAATDARLPEDAWLRVKKHLKPGKDLTWQERLHRQYLGDLTANRLYRVFNGDWTRGGRLYGGWWIGIPKIERKLIEIDGEPTIELDYGQLHPTMLFAKIEQPLTYDPYQFGPYDRDLGKETFMRLLNLTREKGGRYFKRARDIPMPPGIAAAEYVRMYKQHMAPVKHFFGIGMGLRLQREDSDLALDVLEVLADQQVLGLPIHDSFIVGRKHEPLLRSAMIDCFRRRYGFDPVVK